MNGFGHFCPSASLEPSHQSFATKLLEAVAKLGEEVGQLYETSTLVEMQKPFKKSYKNIKAGGYVL